MPGRHQQRPPGQNGLRWLAGAVGLAIAGAAVIAVVPASAAGSTTDAQLSLSGVATKGNVLGGTTIGVHPGDTVDFKTSALPTAGLNNVPGLGDVVNSVLGGLTTFQVSVDLSGLPGGSAKTVLRGSAHKAITFPVAGTYKFTWTAQVLNILGAPVPFDLNPLKSVGVAFNASNQWTGQIVVAANPPPPGISIQLPGISVAPSVTGVGQLPTIG
ncbi:MAG: hypothetical protein JWO57_412, partial [Pseudonocardiales bacterium]|nr:hypothetical protein [Pseudonocardiales bacterium]